MTNERRAAAPALCRALLRLGLLFVFFFSSARQIQCLSQFFHGSTHRHLPRRPLPAKSSTAHPQHRRHSVGVFSTKASSGVSNPLSSDPLESSEGQHETYHSKDSDYFESTRVVRSADPSDPFIRISERTNDAFNNLPSLSSSRWRSIAESFDDHFRLQVYLLLQAAIIGILAGGSVAAFKAAIATVRTLSYSWDWAYLFLPLIPAVGGLVTGLLAQPGPFPPGLKGSIREVDQDARALVHGAAEEMAVEKQQHRHPCGFVRKTAAAVATLGTGSSLGPEGPSVEVGLSVSRVVMNAFPPLEYVFGWWNDEQKPDNYNNNSMLDEWEMVQRGRLLLTCGCCAGVSAGFNAPLAGVFFALEIVQGAAMTEVDRGNSTASIQEQQRQRGGGPLNISAILLSSVLSALVFRSIWGNEMVLSVSAYDLQTPLNEMPLYLLLGITCGVVSFVFSLLAKMAKSFFGGELGPDVVRRSIQTLPQFCKPALGGLLCGLLALPFPQILFFGYETLNALLNSVLDDSLTFILSLLVVKTIATALAAGSGLVGGTFAPSLFLGAMTGAAFRQVADFVIHNMDIWHSTSSNDVAMILMELADSPAYAMVGAASVLAALFRAPLTASLLLFEMTRDYDVILPLMVSAGVSCLVADVIESVVERDRVNELRRDRDSVSWGDLADAQNRTDTSSVLLLQTVDKN